jgi:hypothetical protein
MLLFWQGVPSVSFPGELPHATHQICPIHLHWFSSKNALDSANVARLLDGETEISLVA